MVIGTPSSSDSHRLWRAYVTRGTSSNTTDGAGGDGGDAAGAGTSGAAYGYAGVVLPGAITAAAAVAVSFFCT